MRKVVFAAAAAALLGACAGHPENRVGHAGTRAVPTEPGEAVWHLRAGLNVAALMCKGRGRTPVSGAYRQFLDRHRDLLGAAYRADQRRHGAGFERHETQLYNRFANQRDPSAFCRRAAEVAERANRMSSGALANQAGALLSRID
jgi:hypothetical protein